MGNRLSTECVYLLLGTNPQRIQDFVTSLNTGVKDSSLFDPEWNSNNWKVMDGFYKVIRIIGNYKSYCNTHSCHFDWKHLVEEHTDPEKIMELIKDTQILMPFEDQRGVLKDRWKKFSCMVSRNAFIAETGENPQLNNKRMNRE